jgi:hypothetical protein
VAFGLLDLTRSKMDSHLACERFHRGSDFRNDKKNLSSWFPIARLLNEHHLARQTTKTHLAREDF